MANWLTMQLIDSDSPSWLSWVFSADRVTATAKLACSWSVVEEQDLLSLLSAGHLVAGLVSKIWRGIYFEANHESV